MTSSDSNGDLKASRSEYQIPFEEERNESTIGDLHPTQLYSSEKKLQDIQMLYQSAETIQVDPISILAFGNCLLDYRWTSQGLSGLYWQARMYDFCQVE